MKKQHKIFVDEMIKGADPAIAYKTAYPKAQPESARVKSYTLLRNVTIAESIKAEADKIRSIATQGAALELKNEIVANTLTRNEKLEILAKIARGELEVMTRKPVWDNAQKKFVTIPIMEPPDHIARMKAIDLECKMTGDFAPEKIDHTVNIQPFNDNQVSEIIKGLRAVYAETVIDKALSHAYT